MALARMFVRHRGLVLVVAVIIAVTALAGAYMLAVDRATEARLAKSSGQILSPTEGGAVSLGDTVQGTIDLAPGTFGLITIWSSASQQDYAVQVIGLSGPFEVGLANDIPNAAGEHELRLWIISRVAADRVHDFWPTSEGCATGFAGLDQQRSGFESDPFRLVASVKVASAQAIDEAEQDPTACK